MRRFIGCFIQRWLAAEDLLHVTDNAGEAYYTMSPTPTDGSDVMVWQVCMGGAYGVTEMTAAFCVLCDSSDAVAAGGDTKPLKHMFR